MHKGFLRALRGLWSLLTGFTFPLGSRWCPDLGKLQSEQRRRKGLVIVLPGVEGKGPLNHNLALGLADGGLACAIRVHDWTTGYWPLFAYHLRNGRRTAREAARLVNDIVRYQDAYPNRPVYLVGHSGGGALAVKTLECLPPGRTVAAAYLLAPAISRGYDLSRALGHVEAGVWNLYSPLDCVLLTLGTSLVGTVDGKHDVGAGAWGFRLPSALSRNQRRAYHARLHQYRYRPRLARLWHLGGHFGWTNRVFVSEWLTPLIGGPGAAAARRGK
jgi:pimeloyl-ACP methyl ester carboxylesterase